MCHGRHRKTSGLSFVHFNRAFEISDRFYNGRGQIIYPNVYYFQYLLEKCEKKNPYLKFSFVIQYKASKFDFSKHLKSLF